MQLEVVVVPVVLGRMHQQQVVVEQILIAVTAADLEELAAAVILTFKAELGVVMLTVQIVEQLPAADTAILAVAKDGTAPLQQPIMAHPVQQDQAELGDKPMATTQEVRDKPAW